MLIKLPSIVKDWAILFKIIKIHHICQFKLLCNSDLRDFIVHDTRVVAKFIVKFDSAGFFYIGVEKI
jgi:hypothetical protein